MGIERENCREVIGNITRTSLENSHLLGCFRRTLVLAAFGSSPGSLGRGLTGWLLIGGRKEKLLWLDRQKENDPGSACVFCLGRLTNLLEVIQFMHSWMMVAQRLHKWRVGGT